MADRTPPAGRIAPGTHLKEWMAQSGTDVASLSQQTNVSAHYLSGLLRGTEEMTTEIAARLEKATGITAKMWELLEDDYRRGENTLWGLIR